MHGDIRRAVVALQEAALQTEAARLRRLDPTLRLKDYRLRTIQSLHGTLTIHMPRLARIGGAHPAPPLPFLGGSARSTADYRQLLAPLAAWMRFRAADRAPRQAGRASDRARVCPAGPIPVVDASIKKNT